MSLFGIAFWVLFMITLVIVAFGTLMYRLDPSTDTAMTTIFAISALLTLGCGIKWIME